MYYVVAFFVPLVHLLDKKTFKTSIKENMIEIGFGLLSTGPLPGTKLPPPKFPASGGKSVPGPSITRY
jgi:hypothetical protein